MFDPLTFTERHGDEDGEFVVQVQPLLRFDSAAVRRRHTDDVYDFAHTTRAVAYDPGDFWVVDHLVQRVDPASFTARKPNDSDKRYRRRIASLTGPSRASRSIGGLRRPRSMQSCRPIEMTSHG
jgi:hypothetical protein